MRVGYIREGRPWSIATQAAILVDYGCEKYGGEGPSYSDTTEWFQLLSLLTPGDDVVVASLLVFGSSSDQVNEAFWTMTERGVTLTYWGEVFQPSIQDPIPSVTQLLGNQESSILPGELVDEIRYAYVRDGWSVTEISDHFLLLESSIKEVLFLID